MPTILRPDDMREILSRLDTIGKPLGVRLAAAQRNARPDVVTYEIDGEKIEICNSHFAQAAAFHTDNTPSEQGRIQGVAFEIARKKPDYSCQLLISEDVIDNTPFAALMSTMHEIGHADEIVNGPISTFEVNRGQRIQGVACTEYYSTRLALKLAQETFILSGGNNDSIRYAAPQLVLYNRVVNG